MSGVNWGLGVMPDVGQNALAAFERGRQQRQQQDARNAMAAFATNPDDEKALTALAPHNPEFVIQQRQQRMKAKQEADEKNLIGAALTGDPVARNRLAYVNSEMYLKLDEGGRKQMDAMYDRVGQAAFSILQMPEGQQGPALQQFMQQMQIDPSKLGFTGNATQDLKMALAYAGKLDEWEKFARPTYEAIGEAGLAGFQFGKPINGAGGQPQNFGNIPPPPPGFQMNPPAQGGGGARVTSNFLDGLELQPGQ